MDVRVEESADVVTIRAVVEAAFPGAAEADLVDALRTTGDAALSVVALEDGVVVGHTMLSRLVAPFPALALAPVAVTPRRQNRGIGSRMVRFALDLARQDGWAGIFVLGDPGYYRRFGFLPEAAARFASQYAGPHLMALALEECLPAHAGHVGHPRPFADLG